VTFLAGQWLWLLLAVAALVGAYVWVQRKGRRRAAVRFTNLELLQSVAPKRPGWQRHVGAALLGLALVAMVVALARPMRSVRVARRQATVMMAIDVSISMEATDVAPSRLQAAKDAAAKFARSLPSTVRLGLVSFAGTASVLVAPTTDHSRVIAGVESLQLRTSTAIGDAVLTSLDAIHSVAQQTGSAPASIVLMSDGHTTVGTPTADAATVAKQAKVPVTTIAYGTATGTIVYDGQEVAVPVDRDELANLASTTGGKAFTAETGSQLRNAYKNIGTAVGYTKQRREATTGVLGIAVVLVLLAAAASLRWTSRLP